MKKIFISILFFFCGTFFFAQNLPFFDKPGVYVFDSDAIVGNAKDNFAFENFTDNEIPICVYCWDNGREEWQIFGQARAKSKGFLRDGLTICDASSKVRQFRYYAIEALDGRSYEYRVTKNHNDLYVTINYALAGKSTGSQNTAGSIVSAIEKAADTLISDLQSDTRVAVLDIFSKDNSEREFMNEELSYKLVESQRFSVVDRNSLEIIRQEKRFQATDEVSDDSAIAIGQMAGAEVVVTGSVSGSGEMRRLRIKALDVKTGKILSMASIKY